MDFTIDSNDLSWMVSIIITFLIIGWMNRRKVRKTTEHVLDKFAMPQIMFHGNENYSLTNMWFNGKRIPDIEVKNKALYLDGQFKRNLARNSQLYNRGTGIFVDGKYVG